MLKNLLQKAKAVLAPKPEWRGSSGETVAQRKARQERDGAQIVPLPFTLRTFGEEIRGAQNPSRDGKHHRGHVYPGKVPNAPHAGIPLEPVGFGGSIRVRRNLRWGHTWLARKVAAALKSSTQQAA